MATSGTLADFETDDETCPNGEPLSFCNPEDDDPEDDELGCFACFRGENDAQ